MASDNNENDSFMEAVIYIKINFIYFKDISEHRFNLSRKINNKLNIDPHNVISLNV